MKLFEAASKVFSGPRPATLALVAALGLAGSAGCAQLKSAVKGNNSSKFKLAKTDGLHGEVHKKNAGKVVFAGEKISVDKLDSIKLADQFTLGDPIYMRVLYKDSLGNIFRKHGYQCEEPMSSSDQPFALWVSFQVDGAPKKQWIYAHQKGFPETKFDTQTTTAFYPYSLDGVEGQAPISVTNKDKSVFTLFSGKILRDLSPGSHKVTLHAEARCAEVEKAQGGTGHTVMLDVAQGTFALNVPSDEAKQTFWATRGPVLPKAQLPEQDTVGPLAVKRLAEKWSKDEILGVATTASQWHITHNKISGNPSERSVPAVVLAKQKTSGQCSAVRILIHQQYVGAGKYQDAVSIRPDSGEPTPVPCPTK